MEVRHGRAAGRRLQTLLVAVAGLLLAGVAACSGHDLKLAGVFEQRGTKVSTHAGAPGEAALAAADEAGAAGRVPTPRTIHELRQIQEQVTAVVEKAMPATVAVRVGAEQGSGVIISPDGYVLTAGHVSGPPGRRVQVIMNDGTVLDGRTLGRNISIDSGLIRITSQRSDPDEPFPHVEMGDSTQLKVGQYCVTLGHPHGLQIDRPAVVRVGRVIQANALRIWTDCTLVGGDSGGPLLDLEGRVVGIHSRIGRGSVANFHVPVNTYRHTWDRMVASESWGRQAFLGVGGVSDAVGCKVTAVEENSAAARAGVLVGDVIRFVDDRRIRDFEDLVAMMGERQPGDEVRLRIMRGNRELEVAVSLGEIDHQTGEEP